MYFDLVLTDGTDGGMLVSDVSDPEKSSFYFPLLRESIQMEFYGIFMVDLLSHAILQK
jgi:hypothetical protein